MVINTFNIIICSSIVLILFAALGFITMNLLNKFRKLTQLYENNSLEFITMMTQIRDSSQDLYAYMLEVDKGGSFKADDEVGFTFTRLKLLIEAYNNNIQILHSIYDKDNNEVI